MGEDHGLDAVAGLELHQHQFVELWVGSVADHRVAYRRLKQPGNTGEGPAYAVREMTEDCWVVVHP